MRVIEENNKFNNIKKKLYKRKRKILDSK